MWKFFKKLQRMIYSFIHENDNLSYIHILPLLVNSYNERIHTSTGYSPNQIMNSPLIQDRLEKKILNLKSNDITKRKKPSLKLGDWVRISLKKSKFNRSYNVQNTYERFKIYKINTNFRNPRYFLKEEDDSVIEGAFSRSELTKINLDKFKASVVKTKIVHGKKYDLLDFKGYAPKYQTWTLSDNI